MSPLTVLLIVAGVGYVLARRVIGEQVELKALLVLPAVLTIIGLTSLKNVQPVDAATIGFAAFGVLASVALGVVRGFTVHLGERSGVLWMRYRARTIALWLANLAVKAVAVPIERAISPASASAVDHTILLAIGLGILAESAVVVARAMGTDALVIWEKGENGADHTRCAAFDNAQKRVAAGAGFRTRDW